MEWSEVKAYDDVMVMSREHATRSPLLSPLFGSCEQLDNSVGPACRTYWLIVSLPAVPIGSSSFSEERPIFSCHNPG